MPLTTEELQNLAVGDGILLGDGCIREVQSIRRADESRPTTLIEIQEDYIEPDEIEKVIYKAPPKSAFAPTLDAAGLSPATITPPPASVFADPVATITAAALLREDDKPFAKVCLNSHYYYPRTEPESKPAPEPRTATHIATIGGATDDEDLLFALANDGTIWLGPARAANGRFSWIQVPALPQS